MSDMCSCREAINSKLTTTKFLSRIINWCDNSPPPLATISMFSFPFTLVVRRLVYRKCNLLVNITFMVNWRGKFTFCHVVLLSAITIPNDAQWCLALLHFKWGDIATCVYETYKKVFERYGWNLRLPRSQWNGGYAVMRPIAVAQGLVLKEERER